MNRCKTACIDWDYTSPELEAVREIRLRPDIPEAVKRCGLRTQTYHYNNPPDKAVRHYCKRWDCPRCGPLKITCMMRRLRNAPFTHYFGLIDPRGLYTLNRRWASFWRVVKRRYPGIKYVALLQDFHPAAMVALWTAGGVVEEEWLAYTWRHFCGGEVLEFRVLSLLDDGHWLLEQQLEQMKHLGPRFRTIRASRGWAGPLVSGKGREDEDKPISSFIRDVPLPDYATMLQRLGYQVKWAGEDQFWFWPPAEGASLDTPQRSPPDSPHPLDRGEA